MKIIITTPLFPPETGEPANYASRLAEKLSQNHDVTVITYANKCEKIKNVKTIIVPKNKRKILRLFLYTKAVIKEARNANIIYSQKAVASGLPSIIASGITKTPVITNYIEDEAWERLQLSNANDRQIQDKRSFRRIKKVPGSVWTIWHIQRFVLKHSQKITVSSKYLAKELSQTLKQNKEKMLINNTPPKKETVLPFLEEKRKHKLFINSKLTNTSNIETAIHAMKKVADKYPETKLVIAGDGNEKNTLEKISKQLDLTSNISFLGEISSAESYYHIKTSKIFLSLPQYTEQTDKLCDAFRESTIIVASDVLTQNEVLENEVTAFLVPPKNSDACANAIIKIFENEKKTREIAKNAKTKLNSDLSWEAHVKTLLKYFEKYAKK
jgi:glycosyltransferase involved in cell wall biosynthesis